jgi:sulfonate transport system permease protein
MARLTLTAGGRPVALSFPAAPPAVKVPVGLLLPVALLAAWQVATAAHLVAPELLPPPAQVWRTLLAMARGGELWLHVAATLGRLGLGFAIGAAAGIVLGSLTGAAPLARRLLDPLIQGLRSVPSIAWVPLFIIWLGIAEGSKVALIAVGGFFPVYLNLMAGIAAVDPRLVDVARMHGFGPVGVLGRVLLPASLPALVVGLRGGLGLAWMFVAAAELMGASEGLGFLLTDGEQTGRPDVVIAAIILFAVLGRLSDWLLAGACRRLLPPP